MCIWSIPAKRFLADREEVKWRMGLVTRLMARWALISSIAALLAMLDQQA
jgi:hypothetical protein